MASFDLAVLLRSTWRDVAMLDAGGLHRQREVQRKFCAVVALKLPDWKRHRVAELAKEHETGPLIKVSVKSKHPKSCAVVERRVLKIPLSIDPDEFDVDLD